MAKRPSNSEIEKILARRRQAGQPAKKDNASQANLEQAVKNAVDGALAEPAANLSNFLKNFKESMENKNKGAKKMSNIKNNDLARKNAVKKIITNMVNEGVLLPAEEKLIVDAINIDPVLQEFRLTHTTVVRYHVPDIVSGKMVYVEKEMETELNDRHVVQVDEHDYYQFGERAIVSAIEDEVNDVMNEKVFNFILNTAESETATDIFKALSGMGKEVSKSIVICSPSYLQTVLAMNNFPYKIYVSPYLGSKNAIVINPKNIAVNFQIVNVGGKKRFDTGIFDVGFSLMNSGVAQIKAGGIFVI